MKFVALHGVPRSGTSWIGEILNSNPHTVYKFQPLFSYALKNYLTPASSPEEIESFILALETTQDAFLDQTEKRAEGLFPSFAKEKATHVVYKEVRHHHILWNLLRKNCDVKLVAVVRNPMAVINSWLRAPREFRKDLGWSESEEWRYALKKNINRPEEFNGYEKWKEAVTSFIQLKKLYPSRVFLLEYRSLLSDPNDYSQKLFDFCGLQLTRQTESFLRGSTSATVDDSYSVYREGWTDDAWRDELSNEIAGKIIEDLRGTELEKFAYLAEYGLSKPG